MDWWGVVELQKSGHPDAKKLLQPAKLVNDYLSRYYKNIQTAYFFHFSVKKANFPRNSIIEPLLRWANPLDIDTSPRFNDSRQNIIYSHYYDAFNR